MYGTREKKAGSGGADEGVWSGAVNVFETEPVSQNEYLKDLEREERGEAVDPHQVLYMKPCIFSSLATSGSQCCIMFCTPVYYRMFCNSAYFLFKSQLYFAL